MKTILCIDSDRKILDFCKLELEQEGYQVILASDADEAIKIARRLIPQLVVSALRMSTVSGLDIVERIKADHRDIPVVLYTAYKDYIMDFRTWIAEACVEKSDNSGHLKTTIARVLDQRGKTGVSLQDS
jgi:DNA-binding NtrC family response regulator